jgi:hypothetical protein
MKAYALDNYALELRKGSFLIYLDHTLEEAMPAPVDMGERN